MVIGGGRASVKYRSDGEVYHQTLDVVNSGGGVCKEHDLPELPEQLEGFGMTSKKDRYIFVCGGQKRCLTCRQGSECFYTCGMYGLRLNFFKPIFLESIYSNVLFGILTNISSIGCVYWRFVNRDSFSMFKAHDAVECIG